MPANSRWDLIRGLNGLITQAASGTVPSVVDVSCVAVGVRGESNTNGHSRLINDRGNGARGCLCNKIFDSPDDGPAGPKHVEKNCKCKKRKI